MKRYMLPAVLVVVAIGLALMPGSAGAAERYEYPEDFNGPPLYASPFY